MLGSLGGGNMRPAADQQMQYNKDAVEHSARLNQMQQTSPFGRVYYEGAIGSPNRRQVTELTPELQDLFDTVTGVQRSMGHIAAGTYDPAPAAAAPVVVDPATGTAATGAVA